MAKEMHWNDLEWIDLLVEPSELRPENSMNMGQCFNWKSFDTSSEQTKLTWVGVLHGRPYAIRQTSSTTQVAELSFPTNREESSTIQKKFYHYFQLDTNLSSMYQVWSEQCPRMRIITQCLPGVRVVRQDPWECLISFICSSNNNISRITLMLNRLRAKWGRYLCSVVVDSECIKVIYDHASAGALQTFYPLSPMKSPMKRKAVATDSEDTVVNVTEVIHLFSFPSAADLSKVTAEELGDMGFGYRDKFITGTVQFILTQSANSNVDWLESLRTSSFYNQVSHGSVVASTENELKNRKEVQAALCRLPGVGPKVADCVALFSLDQPHIVPVDTHVWRIATRDYAPELKGSTSLSPPAYDTVGDVFRKLFVQHAGWAHSVLFAAELPAFRAQLPEQLINEMRDFEDIVKSEKAEVKMEKKKKKQERSNASKTEGAVKFAVDIERVAKKVKRKKVSCL